MTTMFRPLFLLCVAASSWAAQICCPNIGCFTNDPPFNHFPLPWCEEQMSPSYTMYTRKNPDAGQSFDHNSVPAVFDSSLRTAFIVHGYESKGKAKWLKDMKDAFLKRENINVVILGWEGGADTLNYLQAASNTRSTGAYTALVVDNLVSSGGGANSRMWCVGHSLGSHVCGHAGMRTNLGRITGLDPAGPAFQHCSDLKIGLNPGCADFVDVIHTNAMIYGTLRSIGHVDFYPAGGYRQPGCTVFSEKSRSPEEGEGVLDFINSCEAFVLSDIAGCSHSRAHEYMTESIRSDCFNSRSSCNNYNNIPGSCSSCTCGGSPCAVMGYAADSSCQTNGIYYLNIQKHAPYCVPD